MATDDSVRNIVNEVLQCPEFRSTVERAIRNVHATNVQNMSTTGPSDPQSNAITPMRVELNRLFPSIRQSTRSLPRRSSRQVNITGREKSVFNKDVVLLKGPNFFSTLKGVIKSEAYESGNNFSWILGIAISDVEFKLDWSEYEVLSHLRQLFVQLNCEFEVMLPVAGRLVKPVLENGKQLTGYTLKRLFLQKPIYLRPLNMLVSDIEGNEDVDSNEIVTIECPVFQDETFLTLTDILENLKYQIREDISYINVYREDVYNCLVRATKRKQFHPFNKISVQFSDIDGTSEGAIDEGGPKREMFRLALNYLENCQLFIGSEKKFLTLNLYCLENQMYYDAGKIISLSLVHGGPGPHFFSKNLYEALVKDLESSPCSLEFLEHDIKEKILKFKIENDVEGLRAMIVEDVIFSIAGCYGISSIDEKDKIIEEVVKFYNLVRVKPAFDQFVKGLETCNIYALIKENPELFRELMCGSKPMLTAKMMEELFKISFSELGSNKRQIESRIVTYWRDYLIDIADDESHITLQDLLVFATGVDSIPPLGFPWTPNLNVSDEPENKYPKANTCCLNLTLPVHTSYDNFKINMDFAIANSKDFSFA